MGKADYFVRHGNEERGPTTATRIRELAAGGKLSKDDAIRRGENGDWYRAGDIPGLFDGAGGANGGELIEDPLVNLTKRTAGTIAKAAGQMGNAVKGMMARHAERTASPPKAQVPAKQPSRQLTIVPSEPPTLIDMRGAEESDTCPFCNETIKRGARKCKHCGEFLETGLTTSAQHSQATLPAHVPPQTPHVVVIQAPSQPVQPSTNITFAPVITNDNRSAAMASAKARQKATAVATSFWSRPASGCGCLSILAAGAIGFIVLGIIGTFSKSRLEQNIPAPANGGRAQANVVQPAAKADNPAVGPVPDGQIAAAKEAEIAQHERDAAEKAEHDATTKYKAAKSLMSGNKKAGTERLKEIVAQYPGTEAAADAKELLAGREPKPREPKIGKRLDSKSSLAPPAGETRQKNAVVSYRIAKRWTIPNGGEGKVILIAPSDATEAQMTALGNKLKEETRADRNAFIFIYDDEKAAAMRDHTESLSDRDLDYCGRHFVGSYSRNANSGYHKMEIHVKGIDGAIKVIEF